MDFMESDGDLMELYVNLMWIRFCGPGFLLGASRCYVKSLEFDGGFMGSSRILFGFKKVIEG